VGQIFFQVDPNGHIAMHRVTDERVVWGAIVVNAVVAIAVGEIIDHYVMAGTRVKIQPRIFIGIHNVANDRIVVAVLQKVDPGCRAGHPGSGIAK
jgi:phosphosulfolactate phosphohydrolase-like enzyme